MEKKWWIFIVVIAAVLIIAGISILSKSPVLGSPTGCSDSDLMNYNNAGYVDYQGIKFNDICLTNSYVYEAYCSYNSYIKNYVPSYTTYKCIYGCVSGACLSSNKTIKCYNDSDCPQPTQQPWCEINIYNQSLACRNISKCVNPRTVNARCNLYASCTGCGGPKDCVNGACVITNQTYTCTDSDGGFNLGVKGTTTEYLNGVVNKQAVDACNTNVTRGIIENWCSNSRLTSATYTCLANQTCGDGACITSNSTGNLTG